MPFNQIPLTFKTEAFSAEESGPGMARLGGAKKTGLDQLPQTPTTIGLAAQQVRVRELCLDTSDDTNLTTNQSNTRQGLGENQLCHSLPCELRHSV